MTVLRSSSKSHSFRYLGRERVRERERERGREKERGEEYFLKLLNIVHVHTEEKEETAKCHIILKPTSTLY